MSIKPPVKAQPKQAADFIAAAPDAPEKKGVIRGKKEIITVGFTPAILAIWIQMLISGSSDAQKN